jgi:hypothetical protein
VARLDRSVNGSQLIVAQLSGWPVTWLRQVLTNLADGRNFHWLNLSKVVLLLVLHDQIL